MGGSVQNAGRITGNPASNLTNNYAAGTCLLYMAAAYDGALSQETPVDGETGKDGKAINVIDYLSATWWQRTVHFNAANSAWDFGTPAVYRGYPLLNSVGGQR